MVSWPRALTSSLWLALCATAGSAAEGGASDWALSDGGAYIIHRAARVAWPRCVEGMAWDGRRCFGTPLRLDRGEALALAQSRSKTQGVAWRLPHAKELQHLASHNARLARAPDALLPEAPHGWCWSATAAIDSARFNEYNYGNVMRGLNKANVNQLAYLHGWAVHTATSEARDDVPRRTKLMVRLVMPLD